MTLLAIVLQVVAVVAVLHLVGLAVVLRPEDVRSATRVARWNARNVAPSALVLGCTLAVNGLLRDIGVELSWLIGVNITGRIHALEGRFVADLQSFATPTLTTYFSAVYVFGYVFLLTFPLVVYAIDDDPHPLRTTILAYILNYVGGLVCYVFVIAYGPRNFMPELVESLLFTNWPRSQFLTSQVNVNTNVFPSLHASLSATVAVLAYRFRDRYPRWMPIASAIAASVVVSTMYLGIHWLTDVVAGIVLAVTSVAAGSRIAMASDRGTGSDRNRDRTVAGWVRRRL